MTAIAIPAPAAAATARPRRFALLRHSLVLARRGLITTLRTPEALADVTAQPIIFLLLFTYVFGGAISGGSQHDYLQFLLPGILAQTIAMGGIAIGVNLNTDIDKGVFDRFRSLPIARSAPLVGAVLADIVRYVIVCVVIVGFGYVLGYRAGTSAPEVLAGCLLAVAFALCFCWGAVFVGMIARTPGAVQGIMMLLVLPLSFAQQHVRADRDDAGLAADRRRRQPAHAPDRRRAGAARWRADGLAPAVDVRLDGRPAGRLRAARPTGVRSPRLSPRAPVAPGRRRARPRGRARTPP